MGEAAAAFFYFIFLQGVILLQEPSDKERCHKRTMHGTRPSFYGNNRNVKECNMGKVNQLRMCQNVFWRCCTWGNIWKSDSFMALIFFKHQFYSMRARYNMHSHIFYHQKKHSIDVFTSMDLNSSNSCINLCCLPSKSILYSSTVTVTLCAAVVFKGLT